MTIARTATAFMTGVAIGLSSCGGGGGGSSSEAGNAVPVVYVKASNTGAGDSFGNAVALSGNGNTLAVGAPSEASGSTGIGSTPDDLAPGAGAVYVYEQTGGTWSQRAYVKASNTGAGDGFGRAVALSGDGNTLAVGAPDEASSSTGIDSTPDNLAPRAGAVYVHAQTGGTWSQQAYVKASITGAGDEFGHAVALSGDGNTLAVGAIGGAGAVYVFTRIGGVWTQQAHVSASNAGAGDQFGYAVALSADGSTLAVGALFEGSSSTGINSTPNDSAFQAGAAYVFIRNGAAWSQQAYVKASNTGAGDVFGISVALSGDGDTLAVGAAEEDSSGTGVNSTPNNLTFHSGAAYVLTRSSGTWSQQAFVKASNTGTDDAFGASVALSGDGNTLAVGAIGEASSGTGINSAPDESAPEAGAVYVFTRAGSAWAQQAYVKASNTGAGDFFGVSVALSGDGDTLAVGASHEASSSTGIGSAPNESAAGAGAVYLY